jgi:alpha-L-fucosidase
MKLKHVYSITFLFTILVSCSQTPSSSVPQPIEEKQLIESLPIECTFPVPTSAQLKWQNSELEMFVHFGMNTFTDSEWGTGKEDPKQFNPTAFNASQWVSIAKRAGFQYLILTVKHHDGFCLWPSKYTEHSIKNSPYKNGSGDIVKEVSTACSAAGIKFGFYLSPWDRHDSTYGTNFYNTYYCNQLVELLTNYGEIGEIWLDGTNGDPADGKHQDYDWDRYYSLIKHYQPNAVIAVMGPDIRWIGNERGLGNETEWSFQSAQLPQHNMSGTLVWWPSQCDVSIRNGWFYHDRDLVKSAAQLIDIYFKSIGRNSNLLLNIPPNRQGFISDADIEQLSAFSSQLRDIFSKDLFLGSVISASNVRKDISDYSTNNCIDDNPATFWTTERNILTADIIITLPVLEKINIIKLEEAIAYGQRISSFNIYADQDSLWTKIASGTTVGRTRLIRFEPITTSKIKISITNSIASPTLTTISGYFNEQYFIPVP